MDHDDLPRATPSTQALLEQLFQFDSFYEFNKVATYHLPSLPDYLSLLLKQKGMVREQVIKRAELDRNYGHQVFQGIRTPSRDKVIQLAFGFGLSYEETQKLLKIAQKSPLYPKIERDAAIVFILNQKKTIMDLQALLYDLELPLLGESHT